MEIDEMIKIKDIIKDLELGKVYTDKDRPPFQAESINEDDLGLTYKKGKTVKVKHRTSGKSIVIVDKPAVRKEYEKLGFFAEGTTTPFSSSLIDSAIKVAKSMGGNMTGAVKKIEKIKKGLSDDPKVKAALRKANESVTNENEIKRSKINLLKVNAKYTAEEIMDLYKELNNRDVDSELIVQYLDTIKDRVKMMRKNVGLKESVNEVQKRQATDIAVKFDKAYLNFSREIRDIIKMVVRITGNNTDGKIFNNAYKKHLIPFNELFMSWYKGQQDNPHIKEKVSSPFSKHLINAQNEIEYMISEHSDAEDEGVYSKPHDAIKLLQIAQKSLGKIK